MIGTRLGPYEITAELGEGGMGEGWRATDSRWRLLGSLLSWTLALAAALLVLDG